MDEIIHTIEIIPPGIEEIKEVLTWYEGKEITIELQEHEKKSKNRTILKAKIIKL